MNDSGQLAAPGSASARLFVALDLPAAARTALSDWSVRLRHVAGVRLLEPESFHVTLCFLGRCELGDVDAIMAGCRSLEPQRRLALALGAGLWLPTRRPRAIVIELADPDGALAALQSELSGILQAGGWYQPESRRFLGHVTVARVARRGKPALGPALGPPAPVRFLGTAVTLYRSHLSSAGARYQVLGTVGLTARRDGH